GGCSTAHTHAGLRQQIHLNDPALVRYLRWLSGVLRDDFGKSLVSGRSVSQVLAPRVLNTVFLSIYAFLIYLPLATLPALVQAVRRDRLVDHVLSITTLVLLSLPDFLLGTLLLIVFV